MNINIGELAEEAGFSSVDGSGDEKLNKFAELVIRNCAAIAIEEAEFCELKMMPFSTMEWKILKRFGIDFE